MATLKSKDNKELVILCKCGCDEGLRIKIDDSYGDYAYMTYLSSNFYQDQKHSFIAKIKKIWKIIRNKDYYYSDIILSKEDFENFREYINEVNNHESS